MCQSRVMIVGHYGAGKSSLLRCLLKQPIQEEHIPTIGIETENRTKVYEAGADILISKAENWTLQQEGN